MINILGTIFGRKGCFMILWKCHDCPDQVRLQETNNPTDDLSTPTEEERSRGLKMWGVFMTQTNSFVLLL
jgi:hypothetical protein